MSVIRLTEQRRDDRNRTLGSHANKSGHRLGAIAGQYRAWQQRRRLYRYLLWAVLSVAVAAGLTLAVLTLSPWPPALTLRHIAAFPNCDAARAQGLAPARRGEPGYYFKHDRDKDGIACEVWPRHGVPSGGPLRLPIKIRSRRPLTG